MRSNVVLSVQRVFFARMQVNLSETAVDVVFGVQASGNVCAGCAIDIHSTGEHIGEIKNRVSRSSIAVRIEARNFQAGWAQRHTGCAHRIASTDDTCRVSSDRPRVGIHARISEGRWVSYVVALAFIGEKEKGLVLL